MSAVRGDGLLGKRTPFKPETDTPSADSITSRFAVIAYIHTQPGLNLLSTAIRRLLTSDHKEAPRGKVSRWLLLAAGELNDTLYSKLAQLAQPHPPVPLHVSRTL